MSRHQGSTTINQEEEKSQDGTDALVDMRPPDHPPPDPDDSAFAPIPDEVAHIILGFLSAIDLAQASATCRRFRVLCSSPRLWRRLLLLDFHVSALDIPAPLPPLPPNLPPPPPGLQPLPPPPSTSLGRLNRPPPPPPPSLFSNGSLAYDLRQAKTSYLKRAKDVEKRKLEREKERKRQQAREQRIRRRRRLIKFIELFNFKYLLPLFGTCALATFALVVEQMEESIEKRYWPSVFAPPLVFVAWIGVSIGMGTYLYRKRLNMESVWGGVWDAHIGPASLWMIEVASPYTGKRYERTIAMGYLLYALVVLFGLLLALQSNGVSRLNWTICFIPMWLFGIIVTAVLTPPLKDSTAGTKADFAMTVLVVILPLLIFAVLLPLYLDKYLVASLEVVFVPLWLQDAIYYVLVAFHTASQLSTAGWDWKEIRTHLCYLLAFVVFFSPIVVFQILLCVVAASPNSMSPAALFSPLFVWFSMFTIVALSGICSSDEHPAAAADWSEGEASRVIHSTRHASNPNRIREAELARGYGSRHLNVGPHHQNHTAELLRNSWAQSMNPQFDHAHAPASVLRHHNTPGIWESLPDFGFDLGDMDAVEGATLSDFHRMQLAISRALADMNQEDARAIVHSAASAVQHAAALNSVSSNGSVHGSEGARFEEEDEMILAEPPRTPNMPPPVLEEEEEEENENENEEPDQLDLA